MTDDLMKPPRLDIDHLLERYRSGELTPRKLFEVLDSLQSSAFDRNVWIHYLTPDQREPYIQAIEDKDPASLPLYGIPFAIKDNIHLSGIPTTAANRNVTILPDRSAFVVERLIAAGAIPLGKTNLDQFATGLNGTRSDFGACGNSFDSSHIAGGSSSGSAVAVALGLVSFALGTDTAGSGRVPAALNNIVGLKPTLGRISCDGIIPACQTLDCVSVFARTAAQGNRILQLADCVNAHDAWQRDRASPGFLIGEKFKFGIPVQNQLNLNGLFGADECFSTAIESLEAIGGQPVEIDLTPFLEAAELLYTGPWVAERLLAITSIIGSLDLINRSVRGAIERAQDYTASDLFLAQYRLRELKRTADEILASVDAILTPTCPIGFTIAEMESDPLKLNSNLGKFTNFMNLLDYSAVAVPSGFTENGIPWGVTLFGPAWSDSALAGLAHRLHMHSSRTIGATGDALPTEPFEGQSGTISVAVCGAHLEGFPLNVQITSRGGILKRRTRTAPSYRFYALSGGPPFRPGLVRTDSTGESIEVEIWEIPSDKFGSFVADIPHPLGIGKLELEDGSWCAGFICEPIGLDDAEDISHFGGWRGYMSER